MTLNQIIEEIRQFTDSHYQLNTFFSGDTWDFQAQTNIYPALISVQAPATISSGRMTVSFNIFITDICNKDRSNVDEILSDTLQIMGDLYAYFRDRDEYGLVGDLNVIPFSEEFDDVLAGWNANFEFEFMFSASDCGLPKA
jgi:hypothetical protein